jgi:hypothetical protein
MSKTKLISPCIDCTERFPGCHDSCERGIEYSKQLKAMNEAIRVEKSKENQINRYKIERVIKTKERVGLR